MGPPVDSPPQPPPPPGPPGPRGFPVTPSGGTPPSRWTWQRLLLIAGAVVVVGLVVAAVVLATRKPPPSPTPSAVATASASASPSPSPSASPTATPTAAPKPTATPRPTATATPTATPIPQNTPTQQADLLFPSSGSECGSNGTYTGCPVTSGLVDAANQWRSHHASSPQPLCRCPSTYSSTFAQQNDTLLLAGDQGNPDRAAVQVSLTIPSGTENMVLLFSRQNGAWIATDTYCDSPMNRLTAGAPTTC